MITEQELLALYPAVIASVIAEPTWTTEDLRRACLALEARIQIESGGPVNGYEPVSDAEIEWLLLESPPAREHQSARIRTRWPLTDAWRRAGRPTEGPLHYGAAWEAAALEAQALGDLAGRDAAMARAVQTLRDAYAHQ